MTDLQTGRYEVEIYSPPTMRQSLEEHLCQYETAEREVITTECAVTQVKVLCFLNKEKGPSSLPFSALQS